MQASSYAGILFGLFTIGSVGDASPKRKSEALVAEPGSIAAQVTMSGKTVSFACKNPPASLAADTSATGSPDHILIGCVDPVSGLEVSAAVKRNPASNVPNADETTGRINVTVPSKHPDDDLNIITTSKRSVPGATKATGTTNIAKIDTQSGHVVGSAKMQWKKDKTGGRGEATIAFDLVLENL